MERISEKAADNGKVESVPTITCEFSESLSFEGGKTYSVSEFDRIMRNADAAFVEGKKAAVKYYGSQRNWDNAFFDGERNEFTQFVGYDKTKFTINLPNGEKLTERQDIGDGYGGVVDFLKKYSPRFDEVTALLEETIKNEAPEYYAEHFAKSAQVKVKNARQIEKDDDEISL